MLKATYTIAEVAQLLRIGESSAYAAAKKDGLPVPVIKIGGRYVVPRAPLDALLGITPEHSEAI